MIITIYFVSQEFGFCRVLTKAELAETSNSESSGIGKIKIASQAACQIHGITNTQIFTELQLELI
jgi:hypothetical protein